MTATLERRLREDRAMRDQALALVKADIAHLKADYSEKGVGERAKERLLGGATDIYEEAAEVASDNRGIAAAVIAALLVWIARNPILNLLFGRNDEDDDELDEDYDERDYARD